MRRFVTFGPAFVVLLTAVVTLFATPAAVRHIGYASTDVQVHLARQTLDDDDILERINRAVRAVADSVEPSVVHVQVAGRAARGTGRRAQGSGWVYDQFGHIVTNAHVIRDATTIMVQFHDGRMVRADVVGQDSNADIAVLRVATTEGLVPARRASDSRLKQGDRVFAFGSPFGFKFSMSEGIVSGLGRDPRAVIGEGGYTNFIQTDASVNPGNSGGPLVDIRGQVVGMNVAIATGANSDGTVEGQSSGISFAIPLETIEAVASQLIDSGVVTRGFLGITHTGDDDLNNAELLRRNFRGRGVIVMDLADGGPAQRAGLRAGDVITSINGRHINGVPSLRTAVANNMPGDQVEIEYIRGTTPGSVRVTLGSLPPSRIQVQDAVAAITRFGIADVVQRRDGAIVVNEVRQRSRAVDEGFRPGQVIVSVGGERVGSIGEFQLALASQGLGQGRDVHVRVIDADGSERQFTIPSR